MTDHDYEYEQEQNKQVAADFDDAADIDRDRSITARPLDGHHPPAWHARREAHARRELRRWTHTQARLMALAAHLAGTGRMRLAKVVLSSVELD